MSDETQPQQRPPQSSPNNQETPGTAQPATSAAALDEVIAHSAAAEPTEICGIHIGVADTDQEEEAPWGW